MTKFTASEARASLYRLIDQTAESHQPVLISGKRTNAVLVSEEDWSAIQETLYLLAVPGIIGQSFDSIAKLKCLTAEDDGSNGQRVALFVQQMQEACATG